MTASQSNIVISFDAKILGDKLRFDKALVPDPVINDCAFKSFEIEGFGDSLKGRVEFLGDKQAFDGYINSIINHLGFQYNVNVVKCSHEVVVTQQGETRVPPLGSRMQMGGSVVVSCEKNLTKNDVETELAQFATKCSVDKSLYRNAMSCTDPVARYMFLYCLLLFIVNKNSQREEQKPLDDFIRREFPRTPESQPVGFPYKETIYSRLRNEIAHVRQNVDPCKTRQEIDQWLPKFIEIVRKAINNCEGR